MLLSCHRGLYIAQYGPHAKSTSMPVIIEISETHRKIGKPNPAGFMRDILVVGGIPWETPIVIFLGGGTIDFDPAMFPQDPPAGGFDNNAAR